MAQGKAAKPTKPRVVKVTFPAQAAGDYPQSKFEAEGSNVYADLQRQKAAGKKLTQMQQYLVLKHFPEQQKMFNKQKKTTEAKNAKKRSDEEAKQARRGKRAADQAEVYQRKV